MTPLGRTIVGLSVVDAFIVGVLAGHSVSDIPYLTLNHEASLVDILSLIVTTAIAVMIPFVLEKLLADFRGIKSLLIDELKELLNIVNEINCIITTAHHVGVFTDKDRKQVISSFYKADLKIVSIREQVAIAYNSKRAAICESLKDLLFVYQDFLTGDVPMRNSFKTIDDRFNMENITEFSKLETGLKKTMQQVSFF